MRRLAAALAAAAACMASGCGFGPGALHGGASVLVTADFGTRTLGRQATPTVPSSETVMRLLERSFNVTTRYGGGFVESIGGVAGGHSHGRLIDWFYYVNGIEAPNGAATTTVYPGDAIWWDRHDWGAAMSIPAVVGSYPEPFLHGTGGKRVPVRVDCAEGANQACQQVEQRLESSGVIASGAALGAPSGQDVARVLVGPWSAVEADGAAEQLVAGPSISGVYARPSTSGSQLQLLNATGAVVETLDGDAGLVAATRYSDQDPTWVVTGTDAAGVAAAVTGFDAATLDGHFAVAFAGGRAIPLPVVAR